MRKTAGRLAIVVLAVGIATALTEASFALGAELTFEWYVAAVACTAWWCGRRAALVAAVLSSALSDFLYLPFHRLSFGIGLADAIRLVAFVGLAVLVAHLVAARSAAERERAGRERLVAMVAHELANTIRAFQTWIAVLRRNGVPDAEREHATRAIERATHALGKLAGDLLDWPRIATGHFDLEPEELDLAEIVRDTVEEMRDHAAAHAVTLKCSFLPAPVHADRDRLHQVARNVLADSLATTPRGGTVTVSVRATDRRAVLSVHGTGGDAALPALPRHVLDPDTRVPATDGAFGLALARELMRAQGGDVAVYGGGFRGNGATRLVRLPTSHTG
jgi:signal transduction histidine kinase